MTIVGSRVVVVGGGLAGSEAAWQCAVRGVPVTLYEMRPQRPTAAHRTGFLAELVCSNSFKSRDTISAHGLLKAEMELVGSLILNAAARNQLPAGAALAVDRDRFAAEVTSRLEDHPLVEIVHEEITSIPAEGPAIIATGPLCSAPLAEEIVSFTGEQNLSFYDAISPIVDGSSINLELAFRASRYGKGGGSDYLNCPLDKQQYEAFHGELLAAELAEVHDFDRKLLFEGCLPIEELALRGVDTLRFGPMKPVGLVDPRTERRPWAVIQLRQDNLAATHWSMVGFQNRLKWGEQKRIFRLIPGLERAEFVKLGMIHRNTYINAPRILKATFQCREREDLLFAGQISGVEGYTESTASGMISGIGAAALILGERPPIFPRETALGALQHYISHAQADQFQPTNFAFGLLPRPADAPRAKRERKKAMSEKALTAIQSYLSAHALRPQWFVAESPAATASRT